MPRISSKHFFRDYPLLMKCLDLISHDSDMSMRPNAEIPIEWLIAVRAAEWELAGLTQKQLEDFAIGEMNAYGTKAILDRKPLADWILLEAFEGRLNSIIYLSADEDIARANQRASIIDDEDIPF